MKIYRSNHPLFVASFTDDETYSIVPPGNQAVDVPDNLWASYEMKLVELQQLENAISEYFKSKENVNVTFEQVSYNKDEWK